MATDAVTLIDALGLTNVDLVGHSLGGLVVQQVAIQRRAGYQPGTVSTSPLATAATRSAWSRRVCSA
jgi:pimeloyl-ACP methyl ester carboxylesterase